MSEVETLKALAEQYGIVESFRDLSGIERPTSQETILALLNANGVDTSSSSAMVDQLAEHEIQNAERFCADELIVTANTSSEVSINESAEWVLSLEEGITSDLTLKGYGDVNIKLPPLSSGIHTLQISAKQKTQTVTIIAAPENAPSLFDITGMSRIWGVNTALYGLHSKNTCGLGTYSDLANASEAMSKHGASFLGINPVHSIGWADQETISPYSPSHRGFLNTAHIDLLPFDNLPRSPSTQSTTLNYDAHRRSHNIELKKAFADFERNAKAKDKLDFSAFITQEGQSLQQFALFETLSEVYGPNWRDWPRQFQNSECEEVSNFSEEHSASLEFHSWLQWLADKQLGEAQSRARASGMKLGLYLDLAVGARRGAAETWCENACIAQGVSIGAPPDHLSPAGQNWNLAAFAPEKLKQTQYGSFRTILTRALRHAGILRIDHVLGLNRSYWIPDNGAPGGYIRQPFEALLAIVAIEAQKAGTVIVGEDLGLVPDGFRKRLRQRGLYSYSVLQYEEDKNGEFKKPHDLEANSLICFSTHDTPTLHGYMVQRDIDWWRKFDWIDDTNETKLRTERKKKVRKLLKWGAKRDSSLKGSEFQHLSHAVHGALANSPVAMVSVQLDDVLGEVEAQNLPGTVSEHENWQRRASIPIEQFSTHPDLVSIGNQMRRAKRSTNERQVK